LFEEEEEKQVGSSLVGRSRWNWLEYHRMQGYVLLSLICILALIHLLPQFLVVLLFERLKRDQVRS
jgi:hypothetical protein